MTSFPAAITYAEEALRSILRGTVLPDKLVLYLTFSQFPSGRIPDSLVALAQSSPILEIRDYPIDIRSYRKLIPALDDFPDDVIVTVDDDIRYHKNMLRDLLWLHEQMPRSVIAHRVKLIRPGKPYRRWRKYRWYHFFFRRIHSGYLNLQTGVAGVLYPPHALKDDMLDPQLFLTIAPTTDDLWFWAAAVRNLTPIVPVPFGHNKPHGLPKPKHLQLKTTNVHSRTDRNAQAFSAILQAFPDLRHIIENDNPHDY